MATPISWDNANFSSETTDIVYNGQTYKFKLVGCTYHCG